MLDEDQTVAEPPRERSFDAGTARRSSSGDGAALAALAAPPISAVTDAQFNALSGRVSTLETRMDRFDLRLEGMEGGIAAAMALGSAMVVPDSNISVSLNAATYGGEQGFAGTLIGRLGERVYLSAGVAGNTGDDRVGAQVGVAFGF